MAKLTLLDVISGYAVVSTYNSNNTSIETAIENTLSRDGTAPNSMGAILDMGGFKVQNLADATLSTDVVNLRQLQGITAVASGSIPLQTGNANKVLKTDGTVVAWDVVSIAGGGTGATTAGAARTALGSTATGDALFIVASSAAAQKIIGGTNSYYVPHAETVPSALKIVVDAGNLFVNGALVVNADQTVTLATAHATLPRIDRVLLDSNTGAVIKIDGTAAASPVAPAFPAAAYLPVAQVLVTAAMTVVANSAITDERTVLNKTTILAIADGGTGASNADAARTNLGITVKRKSADESVVSSITLQNDDHLIFPVAANEEWVLDYWISAGAALATTGAQFGFDVPAGFAGFNAVAQITSSVVRTASITAFGFTPAAFGVFNEDLIHLSVWFLNGANAGNITLQWSQQTSSASTLLFRKGSYATARKI